MSYDDSDYIEDKYSIELDEEVETTERDSHSNYRVIMYNKLDIEILEKLTMKYMLSHNLGPFSTAFNIKAALFFPDLYPDNSKKKRGKKPSIYFIEDVAKFLWEKWNISRLPSDRNDFLTYCYPLIDGVIFKYQRHKHGLSYDEIFQSAVIKIIQAMDKFDPKRIVSTDDKGNPIYARVFTYFTMILNYSITTLTMTYGAEKLTNSSYEYLARSLGHEPEDMSDAAIIFQEFLIFLDSILLVDDLLTESEIDVFTALRTLLKSQNGMLQVSVNPIVAIKPLLTKELKVKEIAEIMGALKELFGPVIISSDSKSFNLKKETDDF